MPLPSTDDVFRLVASGQNAVMAQVSENVQRQRASIARLEEITREVDEPFVSSYFSI